MAAGSPDVKVSFISESKSLVRDVGQMERALEDGAEALSKLGEKGEDASREVERGLDKISDASDDMADDVKRDAGRIEDALREVARESGRAGKAVGDDVGRGFKKAEDAASEFKDESTQIAKESATSFSGEFEDVADVVRDLLANALVGFGPAGLAAGVAAAAGIGLVISAFEKNQESAEAAREAAAELAAEYIETGRIGEVSIGYLSDRLIELSTNTEDGQKNLRDLFRQVESSGTDAYKEIAQAYAGNAEGLDDLIDSQEEYREKLRDSRDEIVQGADESKSAYDDRMRQNARAIADQDLIIEGLEQAAKTAEEAEDAQLAYAASGAEELEAKAEAIDAVNGMLDDSISGWKEFAASEDEAADPAGFVQSMADRNAAAAGFYENVMALADNYNLSAAETQYILDQGLDFAPMLASVQGSGLEGAFISEVQKAVNGGEAIVSGGDFNATGELTLDAKPGEFTLDAFKTKGDKTKPKASLELDTGAANRDINEFMNRARTAHVGVSADTAGASSAINRVANASYRATIIVETRDKLGRRLS